MGSDLSRTLVTQKLDARRLALLAVGLGLLLLAHGALHHGSVHYDCARAPDGSFTCDLETHSLLDAQQERVVLRAPTITVWSSARASELARITVQDAEHTLELAAPSTSVAIDVADALRRCMAEARPRCAMERANLSEVLFFAGVLACPMLLVFLVLVGTRASLVADRARGEVRVLRTFAFLPREVVVVSDPRAVRLELRPPEG